MKASTHSPAAIFGLPVRYVVPLFQRPYVWTMTDQWEPLWEDVRALTERLIATPANAYGPSLVAPHFLGAIVLEQQLMPSAFVEVRHVVDGQQRLTTLQLLLDAAQLVVEQHGTDMDSKGLRVLVLNDAALSAEPDHVYKVWPTDRDQDAFRAAMDNDAVVSADLATSRVAQAHAYFVDAITTWAEVTDEPTAVQLRLNGLVRALREHLKLVVIDLEPGDNAQVIFETLNTGAARCSPLTWSRTSSFRSPRHKARTYKPSTASTGHRWTPTTGGRRSARGGCSARASTPSSTTGSRCAS